MALVPLVSSTKSKSKSKDSGFPLVGRAQSRPDYVKITSDVRSRFVVLLGSILSRSTSTTGLTSTGEGILMAGKLDGKKVAVLVTDGFEQVEMTKPREALEEAGAQTMIVSPKSGQIQGMNHADQGDKFDVDIPLDEARPEEFDALMIPGGLMNPDELRAIPDALEFTKHFFREGKPVAAICHAPWVLIDAGVVRGRKCRPT